MKNSIAVSLALLFIMCLVQQSRINDLNAIRSDLTQEKNKVDSLYMWQSERLLNYTIISMKLNNIVDKFQSSRNEKLKNKELINKMSEL